MSYGIVRVQKMGKGSVKGIEIHDRREKDISHTNKDIDWQRSSQNYDLHPAQNQSFTQAVKQRINELNLPKAVRKDAVVMAQVLVTSDQAFFEKLSKEQQKQFFQDSYDFLADRYGRENIISAIIHMDEKTPHMHFNFVPVTTDGRLSAKSILTRQSLTEQQTAFFEQVGAKYGLQRGELGSRGRRHLETAEYKTYAAELNRMKEQVEDLTQTHHKATESVSKAHMEAQGIRDSLIALNAEYEALRAFMDDIQKSKSMQQAYPPEVKVTEKGVFRKQSFVTAPKELWEQRTLLAAERDALDKALVAFKQRAHEFSSTHSAQYIAELEKRVKDLEMENYVLKRKEKNTVDKIKHTLNRISPNAAREFLTAWNAKRKAREQNRER